MRLIGSFEGRARRRQLLRKIHDFVGDVRKLADSWATSGSQRDLLVHRLSRMLSEKTRRLAEGANHAVLTTLFPSGGPQTNVVWIDHDGEHLLVNSETERQKVRNVRRDPRVAVLVFDPADMDNWVEVRGRVVEIVEGEEARRHIDALAQKYLGVPDYPNTIRSPRVILKIALDRENVY